MSRSPRQPAELLDAEPFLGWWAVDEGLLTPDELRSSAGRRLYVHRDVPVTHAVRAHAACVLLPAAVVTGPSAAVLWGVELVGPEDDVEVTVPPTSHPPAARPACAPGVPPTCPEVAPRRHSRDHRSGDRRATRRAPRR